MINTLLRQNKRNWILGAACLLLGAHQASAISLGFSSDLGASIQFQNGTFQFAGGGFSVGTSDGVGDSVGLLGNLSGIFTIGSITDWGGGFQTAPVTGSGTFSISDGNFSLLATLTWSDIYTSGAGGGTNVGGILNLSGITYGGSNADLLALLGAGTGVNVVSFQFSPAMDLVALTAPLASGSLPFSTSYSGSLFAAPTSVPEGASTLALLSMALAGVEALRRKLKLG